MTQERIDEYQKRYHLDLYRCQHCGKLATQIAHRIARLKTNYKIYGKEIIDSNLNIVSVCSLSCNDKFSITYKPMKCKKLIDLIKERGDEEFKSEEITRYLND